MKKEAAYLRTAVCHVGKKESVTGQEEIARDFANKHKTEMEPDATLLPLN